MDYSALDRQKDIYLNGVAGNKPIIPTDYYSLEAAAKKILSTKAYAYLAGGAGLESTSQANQSAWEQFMITPRVLQGVTQRDLNITFLNQAYTVPFFLCPIGVLELAHPQADLDVARACATTGVPMMISSQASHPMEAIVKELRSTPWYFQLYVSKSDALVKSFVQRAEQAGALGIVITLDTTLLGWRNRDLNLGYLPFLQGKGIAQYTSDPIFNRLVDEYQDEKAATKINIQVIDHMLKLARKIPGDFKANLKGRALKSVRTFTQLYSRPDLNWDVLNQIRSYTSLPLMLKGIQHPDDALKAHSSGMDALYVSNHGGRQVDGAISSLEALINIKNAVGDTIPILFDSGVRSGAHIMKALACGASMVGIGRPYTYALALKGRQGVETLIKNLAAELELNMALSGVNKATDLGPGLFQHRFGKV